MIHQIREDIHNIQPLLILHHLNSQYLKETPQQQVLDPIIQFIQKILTQRIRINL